MGRRFHRRTINLQHWETFTGTFCYVQFETAFFPFCSRCRLHFTKFNDDSQTRTFLHSPNDTEYEERLLFSRVYASTQHRLNRELVTIDEQLQMNKQKRKNPPMKIHSEICHRWRREAQNFHSRFLAPRVEKYLGWEMIDRRCDADDDNVNVKWLIDDCPIFMFIATRRLCTDHFFFIVTPTRRQIIFTAVMLMTRARWRLVPTTPLRRLMIGNLIF